MHAIWFLDYGYVQILVQHGNATCVCKHLTLTDVA